MKTLEPMWSGTMKSPRISASVDISWLASYVVDRAWRGNGVGVRIYRWPCGTSMVVRVGSVDDRVLLRDCPSCLLITCTRGVTLKHVVDTLRWSLRHPS